MSKFKLLQGGKTDHVLVKGTSITVIPDTTHPIPVDIRVFEEDTHLVLTVDPVMRYTEEHPIRLLNSLSQGKTGKPGTIVVNGASWYAVVHDLDAEKTCCPEWVAEAYRELLILAGRKKIRRIGIPLLGSVHGDMPSSESLQLILECLSTYQTGMLMLKNIAIIVKPDLVSSTKTMLAQIVQ